VFCYYDKISEISNLKGGKVCFGLCFQKFESTVAWPHCCGPVYKAEHYGGEHMAEEVAHLMAQLGSKEREKSVPGS
jgi:hypothetical protein